ncbi:MAG: hypothetical protein HY815_16500 [Candidatus Riflebacteria bacterium]|nr:hypothetical protein [Candidatus Riflebacteria bacterium]
MRGCVWVLLLALASVARGAEPPSLVTTLAEPLIVGAIGFRAQLVESKVVATWNRYMRPDFKCYKVMKSTTDPDPVWPEVKEVFSSTNRDWTRYVDPDVERGRTNYRVLVITTDGDRWASPVSTITIWRGCSRKPLPTASDFAPPIPEPTTGPRD